MRVCCIRQLIWINNGNDCDRDGFPSRTGVDPTAEPVRAAGRFRSEDRDDPTNRLPRGVVESAWSPSLGNVRHQGPRARCAADRLARTGTRIGNNRNGRRRQTAAEQQLVRRSQLRTWCQLREGRGPHGRKRFPESTPGLISSCRAGGQAQCDEMRVRVPIRRCSSDVSTSRPAPNQTTKPVQSNAAATPGQSGGFCLG